MEKGPQVIGVDANVLVRLLTADEPVQAAIARRFFDSRSTLDPAFVSAVTLAETVRVLRKVHRLELSSIANAIAMMLSSDDFVVEGAETLRAIADGEVSPDLVADFLVAWLGSRAGCASTVTFDGTAAARIPAMELLS